jgi:hypothetical protein
MEFQESIETDTPMGLLRGIKCGTETYHVLFMRLCRYPCFCRMLGKERQLYFKSLVKFFLKKEV